MSSILGEKYKNGEMKNYYDVINSKEYSEKQSEIGIKRYSRNSERVKQSIRLREALSTPEARQKKSESSKASTELRLQRRVILKDLREKLSQGGDLTEQDMRNIGAKTTAAAMRKIYPNRPKY